MNGLRERMSNVFVGLTDDMLTESEIEARDLLNEVISELESRPRREDVLEEAAKLVEAYPANKPFGENYLAALGSSDFRKGQDEAAVDIAEALRDLAERQP